MIHAVREQYRPIPGQSGHGYTTLDIRPPGDFMPDEQRWMPFVGGCGVGYANTAEGARILLLRRAKEYCERQIRQAEATAVNYRAQLDVLNRDGLVEI